ncbi:ATP-binding protein [Roseateles asaccharophilus]|uniref:histidine kinase n=1 Tax=Roseateles asaccharophilus TaxID=582607 RepID=A0ABU2A6U2_9BURK|nr:ATP-binding protein [Roseateles asaccharophilus]MDR7332921.1 two-component system sensor histidine kinase QseC [Roseateles asaccharophilus]
MRPEQSLFKRLLLGFSGVILFVALCGFIYVAWEARETQRSRTASENSAHARELLMHLADVADKPGRVREAAAALEAVRAEMFRQLDYHSQVRVRVWQRGELLYNSLPELPDALPLPGTQHEGNAWVQAVERDAASGIAVERSHEVDDRWMLSYSGVSFLLRSTIFSLPLLLLPAWFIIGMGLKPLRAFAAVIENRSAQDLTPLPVSPYRELSPLVVAINHLMARLRRRIEHEHEFLSDAAHELKTPLAAIQINAHLLQNRGADAEAGARLRDGVARANHLVQQLLSLERARSDAGDDVALPLLSLETLVRDRLAAAAPLALQRGIDIDFHADAPCERPLHQESIWALVDNLIGNAIKYSPENGRIAVRLAARAQGGCTLTISDQGPGIAEGLRQRVFERFYRIPGQDESGSGLGLAIAERAAARHGAAIRLDAGPDGRGLLVSVEFA